jgi:hypothetical protein
MLWSFVGPGDGARLAGGIGDIVITIGAGVVCASAPLAAAANMVAPARAHRKRFMRAVLRDQDEAPYVG